jgi:hypothetical protein
VTVQNDQEGGKALSAFSDYFDELSDYVCRVLISGDDLRSPLADVFLKLVEYISTGDEARSVIALETLVELLTAESSLGDLGRRTPAILAKTTETIECFTEVFAALASAQDDGAESPTSQPEKMHPAVTDVLSALALFRPDDVIAINRSLDWLSASEVKHPELTLQLVFEMLHSLALAKFEVTALDVLAKEPASPQSPLHVLAAETALTFGPAIEMQPDVLLTCVHHLLATDISELLSEITAHETLRLTYIVCAAAGASYIMRELPHTGDIGLAFVFALPSALNFRHRQGALVLS